MYSGYFANQAIENGGYLATEEALGRCGEYAARGRLP
jgi:hypothetical protein